VTAGNRKAAMNFKTDLIATALIHILRERQLCQGMCLDLEQLRRAWSGTGLRSSDLAVALRDLEAAGLMEVRGGECDGYVSLTRRGADMLFPQVRPEVALQTWMDDMVLYRIRLRARCGSGGQTRRASDQIQGIHG
jgi:hypothetical protein